MAEQRRPESSQPAPIRFGPGGPRRGGPGGPMAGRMNAEKPKNTKGTLRRLLNYIGKSRLILFSLILIMALVTVAELQSPKYQQKAIDTITLVDGSLHVDMDSLVRYLVTMGVIFLISAGLTVVQGLLSASLSQSTVRRMREDLFHKISKLPISYTDSHRHGDIMSRMTNDVENVSNAISQSVTSLVQALLTVIGAIVMMLSYSWLLTLIAMVTLPLTIWISANLGKFMRKYFVRQQQLLGALNGQVEETVTSYKTVVAYGKEPEQIDKFTGISAELRECSIKSKVWGSIMGPVMNFIGNLQYVLVAAFGGWMMVSGNSGMTIGTIQAMLQYSEKFSRPINQIANQYTSILTALAGAERIFEIMDTPDEIDEGKIQMSDCKGNVEFKDIYFNYIPEKPVLQGLNLSVRPGQKIALVGATGSGKTTVVNLLTRFYELNGGSITIDGVNITDIPKADLRRMIAIVLQDTVLFSDTIRNNIKYGHKEKSDEDMKSAAETAKANRFIDRLPEGYDTVLAESGADLSGGQRQLLAIARAVLADPKILILDEATSNVDTRTERHIQEAMVALMKNRTSLIIAHRLSTVRDADVIAVIKDGVVCEQGNHDTLLALNGEYAKLYYSQFAGIET